MDYCLSRLVKQKDNLKGGGLALFKKIRSRGIQVKKIQSDNAGENKALQMALESEECNIEFQYSAVGTPQQTSKLEQKFTTLYGKVCLTLNSERMNKGLWRRLWVKYAPHVTDMENIIIWKVNEKAHMKNSMANHHIISQK